MRFDEGIMFNGIEVIDSDGHVMEPDHLYDEFLESRFKPELQALKERKASLQAKAFFGFFQQLNSGRPLGVPKPDKPLVRAGRRPHGISLAAAKIVARHGLRMVKGELPDKRGGADPHIRVKDMDREGIDIAVLYATVASSFCALSSVNFEVAMLRAYHRWLGDYCAAYPARLKGMAVVPMRDPERAAAMIRELAREPWAVGIYLSAHVGDRLLDHPGFHPIWQALQDADLPACFHGGTARPPYALGTFEMSNNLFLMHAAGNPFETMRGIGALIGGGVLERFPRLKVAFLESGVGWLPFWMERLDEHYELMPEYVPLLKHKPSRAIRSENFFISCDPDEDILPFVVDYVGAEHILYASDYPHFDGRFPHSVKLTARPEAFALEVQRKILCENPRRLYSRI
jgi:uncharacterized protein